MVDREKNLGVRVGDTIVHCNEVFVIVEMQRHEVSGGMRLLIFAMDADQADKNQQEEIKQHQTVSKVTELVNKLTERGLGELGT